MLLAEMACPGDKHIFTKVRLSVCLSFSLYLSIYLSPSLFTSFSVSHSVTQARACTHTHTHAHTHARAHTHTHTHTHTHNLTLLLFLCKNQFPFPLPPTLRCAKKRILRIYPKNQFTYQLSLFLVPSLVSPVRVGADMPVQTDHSRRGAVRLHARTPTRTGSRPVTIAKHKPRVTLSQQSTQWCSARLEEDAQATRVGNRVVVEATCEEQLLGEFVMDADHVQQGLAP